MRPLRYICVRQHRDFSFHVTPVYFDDCPRRIVGADGLRTDLEAGFDGMRFGGWSPLVGGPATAVPAFGEASVDFARRGVRRSAASVAAARARDTDAFAAAFTRTLLRFICPGILNHVMKLDFLKNATDA